jgi:prepilin-type N-terminal cleavage/methylation domain-containing protein
MKQKVILTGFSLIEISIALIIIGIISSISITQINMFNKISSAQKTQSHIDFVVKSIAAYCISNEGSLPYPSDFSTNIGFQNNHMKDSFGIVPFKSLGIMEKFAKDGKGKWLLYKMNPFFLKRLSSNFYKNLDIKEFSSDIKDDKVAFIIKSQNNKGKDDIIVWYSEKNFISSFANHMVNKKPAITTEVPAGFF